MRRYVIRFIAFVPGSSLITAIYFGILIWAQGWNNAWNIFLPNRWYVIPIWITFGIQVALFSILRFRLFVPTAVAIRSEAVIGTISPCHDGHFDIVGNVVSGPPPRPLDEYVVKMENGNLYAQLPPVKRK